jgi:hypothetical protein
MDNLSLHKAGSIIVYLITKCNLPIDLLTTHSIVIPSEGFASNLMDMCIKLPEWVNFVAMQAGNLTDCELCGAQFDDSHKYTATECVHTHIHMFINASLDSKATANIVYYWSRASSDRRRPVTMHNGKNNRQSNTALSLPCFHICVLCNFDLCRMQSLLCETIRITMG